MTVTVCFALKKECELRDGIRLLLGSEAYDFMDVENGVQGLKLVTDNLDLVIPDIMMPEMDGFTICRENRKCSTVPILFLTTKALEEDKLVGLQPG